MPRIYRESALFSRDCRKLISVAATGHAGSTAQDAIFLQRRRWQRRVLVEPPIIAVEVILAFLAAASMMMMMSCRRRAMGHTASLVSYLKMSI